MPEEVDLAPPANRVDQKDRAGPINRVDGHDLFVDLAAVEEVSAEYARLQP
jgi:hypothetical protein